MKRLGLFTGPILSRKRKAGHGESEYSALNSIDRQDAAFAREMLESWFSDLPADAQAELLPRMQGAEDVSFRSAYFEIYLYQLFTRLGYKVEVHPALEDSSRRPDFRLTDHAGQKFYVEAACVFDSAMARSVESLINDLIDEIGDIQSAYFFINLEYFGQPRVALPKKRIRGEIESWMRAFDYDSLRADFERFGFEMMPRRVWEFDGFNLEVSLFPRTRPTDTNSAGTSLGILGPGDAQWIDDRTQLRKTLAKKSSRYGTLNLPLLIAVNSPTNFPDLDDYMDCLFGDEQVTVSVAAIDDEPEYREGRSRNGFWRGPHGPRNRTTSAVMFFSRLTPWNIESIVPTVFHHPAAHFELTGLPGIIQQHRLQNDRMVPAGGQGFSCLWTQDLKRVSIENRNFLRTAADAPACSECGGMMTRNGSCYKCENCGSTSGVARTEAVRKATI